MHVSTMLGVVLRMSSSRLRIAGQAADLARGHTIRSRREQAICMMTRSHDRLPECAAEFVGGTVVMSGSPTEGGVAFLSSRSISSTRIEAFGIMVAPILLAWKFGEYR